MKKRLLIYVIAVIALIAFTACGKKNDPAGTDNTAGTEQTGTDVTSAPAGTDTGTDSTDTASDAASDNTDGGALVGMPNPIEEFASVEAINIEAGTHLTKTALLKLSEETYNTINNNDYLIAEYDFTGEGHKYCFRAAATTEDISGIYVSAGTIFDGAPGPDAIIEAEGTKAARWFEGDVQYVLSVTDDASLSLEAFTAVVDDLKASTAAASLPPEPIDPYFSEIEGEYQDTVSQRAVLTLISLGNTASISVSWGSSASETTVWSMTVSRDGDKFSYTDCVKKTFTNPADGSPETTVEYENGTGFFEFSDGKVLWTGASEDSCKSCVFETVE